MNNLNGNGFLVYEDESNCVECLRLSVLGNDNLLFNYINEE